MCDCKQTCAAVEDGVLAETTGDGADSASEGPPQPVPLLPDLLTLFKRTRSMPFLLASQLPARHFLLGRDRGRGFPMYA